METKANYVLVGAFTIVVAVFGLLFALWAAKYSSDRSWNEFDVIFREPVTGLFAANDPVGFAHEVASVFHAESRVAGGRVRISRAD